MAKTTRTWKSAKTMKPPEFRIYHPQGLLRDFVDALYFLSGEEMGTGVAFPRTNQTIIFNVGSRFTVSGVYDAKTGRKEESSPVWINGKQDLPFMLGNQGVTAMYVIIVKLGMLPFFAGLPASATNEQTVGAEHWTGPSDAIFDLQDQLLACPTIEGGFNLIAKFLENHLSKQDRGPLDKVKWLGRAVHTMRVNEICRAMGVTRKRLREDALYYFGGSVKNIQGILRLNNTLSAIARQPEQSLSSLHEYYDQSHFINDFRARTGITPLQYKRLCSQFPAIKHTPNFLPMSRETFLQFISA
ncbi:MAG: helix-turn-helix domain-containing protein [Bacteroidota bacterium]|nr:helix-turn-helix domain-containing protein [Bacteroidota bacterium]